MVVLSFNSVRAPQLAAQSDTPRKLPLAKPRCEVAMNDPELPPRQKFVLESQEAKPSLRGSTSFALAARAIEIQKIA